MKKLFPLFLCLVLFLSACSSAAPASADDECVKITVRDYGEIVVELYPDQAPETVRNFKKLVREGFYTGVLFHRVIKDFVIQAGEPADGKEAATIRGEFKNNGVENSLSHTRGVISMARNSFNYNSASSQFFICHKDSTSLDGDYAAFGKVIAGMDVVDKIAAVETDSNDKPTSDVVIEKAELIARDLVEASPAESAKKTAAETGDAAAYQRSEAETDLVRIDVKGYGAIVVELYPEKAPETVRNFKKLVGQGFYNNLTFHRVIENFMIQGGDPTGTGTGGPGWTIKGEFSKNGVNNDLLHTRGVISMARQGNPYNDAPYYNTAGSQFFICHKDVPSLDGSYAAFGKVVAGMSVVDKIAAVRTDSNDKPTSDVVMSEVYFVTGEET